MKVHILPDLPDGPDPGLGGIHRVVIGQREHLPALGWEYTPNPAEADVIACHIDIPPAYLRLYPEKPFITHSHGAYWSPDYEWPQWCYDANAKVLNSVRTADAVTAVSDWTAQNLRRHSLRPVEVVYHGVDLDEWQPADSHDGYVLWNKTRVDAICDTEPMTLLAKEMRDVQFISTFGDPTLANVELTDKVPYEDAKQLVRRAGVYLATTRETFGIGTLEALAAGVPVVGFAWGGQVEIIDHEADGWLVVPGDIKGLAEGVRWALANRDEIAPRAREKAARFTPQRAAESYARIYQEAFDRKNAKGPRISVIVPVYKMGDYLRDTLTSVAKQTVIDWECIVVNDASPDERDQEIADEFVNGDDRFRVIRHEENRYLAAARNTGIAAARGRYILPLDADDQITPNTLEMLATALDQDRGSHIVYGNVLFTEEDGQTPTQYKGHPSGHSGWPMDFVLENQLRGPGQLLPYASMYRREVWESVAGYRERARSSEDCDFWLRSTSYGFVPRMVTTADTLIYRNRPGSMSRDEGWEEHRPWYPWAGERGDRSLLPAAALREGMPLRNIAFPALDPAVIAVVIPVGPEHGGIVLDAIDSVDAQTFRLWECIVVNDSGEPLPPLPSWVRVIEPPDGDRFGGVAAARNAAIAASRAPMFLPLDADDYLQPGALQLMLDAHMEGGSLRPIVYCDFWEDPHEDGVFTVYETPDYDPHLLHTKGLFHAVTSLTRRKVWEDIGGYDESLPAWEDWAFALAAAARGVCSRRISAPLFTYRKHTGMRRDANMTAFDESKAAMMLKDFGLQQEGELMACGSCPGGAGTTVQMQMQPGAQRSAAPPADGEAVLVEYTGPRAGGVPYKGKMRNDGTRPIYTFSTTQRRLYVMAEDAEIFAQRPTEFRLVLDPETLPQPDAPQPAVMAARTPQPTAPALAMPGTMPNIMPTPEPSLDTASPPPALTHVFSETQLGAMTRADLEAIATDAGIANPADKTAYPNKGTLVDAVLAQQAEAETATQEPESNGAISVGQAMAELAGR